VVRKDLEMSEDEEEKEKDQEKNEEQGEGGQWVQIIEGMHQLREEMEGEKRRRVRAERYIKKLQFQVKRKDEVLSSEYRRVNEGRC